ncbi:CapA family protein [Marivirga harenae]|uniref:CapA family protein n=1 Tax=Marivirga harenae TaxID=2010992 RepID=UPI0026DEC66A|nr:CapA family protein [Marivirga harenae]WKV12777.1 CapA family protein [Marivirga harenae]|tara:strand:- start:90550 stop:91755 length:1206 start_codon:yes stop_codon:yes gene_type:complete
MNKSVFTFLILFIVLSGCKSLQKTSKQDSKKDLQENAQAQIDSTELKKDSIIIALQDTVKRQEEVVINIHPKKADTITVIGVGDIMIGTNFPNEGYLPPDSGKYMLSSVAHVLKDADLTFGNQEGVILNEGGEAKSCSDPSLCYIFRSPEHLAQHYVNAGIDMMSLANNHAGDFGDTGRKNTMRVLDSLGIHHAGQLAQPFSIFEKDRIKYGFVAFSPNNGTQSINDMDAAVGLVQHLDSLTDIIIVSFHGGAEGKKYQHVTREREYFYGENRGNVYEFSHAMIDAGADIIFGHGPHVARAIEVYKNRFIAYSLGNFATYGRFNLRGENGLAPIAKVWILEDGSFIKGKIISALQKGAGIPEIDVNHGASQKIKELTDADFPESKIFIDPEGNIRYIQEQF